MYTDQYSLTHDLKPYQVDGLAFLLYLRNNGIGGILGDEMGLGKTVQTLSLFQHVKENEAAQSSPSLVICPLSVLNTWMSEAKKWTPGLNLMKYHGPKSERDKTKAFITSSKKVSSLPPLSSWLIK